MDEVPVDDSKAMHRLNSELQGATLAYWPEDGFSYPSSVLPDRDPFTDPEHQGTTTLFSVTDPELMAAQGLIGSQGSEARARAIVRSSGIPLPEKGIALTYQHSNATAANALSSTYADFWPDAAR